LSLPIQRYYNPTILMTQYRVRPTNIFFPIFSPISIGGPESSWHYMFPVSVCCRVVRVIHPGCSKFCASTLCIFSSIFSHSLGFQRRAPIRSRLRQVDGPSKRFPFRPSRGFSLPVLKTGRNGFVNTSLCDITSPHSGVPEDSKHQTR
jgi:hypothetical protein